MERHALVASLYEKADVGIHEADLHGYVLAVWQDCPRVGPALLDEAEDVIPTALVR